MSDYFYIATPVKTDRADANQPHASIYFYERGGDAIDVKWSNAKMPLPAIGDRIYMSVNSIGYGEVMAYADCAGWLGLLVKPENPPAWWKRQRARDKEQHPDASGWVRDGYCCVFGAEVRKEKGGPCPAA